LLGSASLFLIFCSKIELASTHFGNGKNEALFSRIWPFTLRKNKNEEEFGDYHPRKRTRKVNAFGK